MDETLDYYRSSGPITAPGSNGGLVDQLPREIDALCRAIQGVVLHAHWAARYGVTLTPERREETQLRLVARQLERIIELDPRPLSEPREPERRLVGTCRDYAVLFAAALRHHGIPARARCGFGRYFSPGRFEDHWVGEYWNGGERRWILVDAQIDDLQRQALSLAFDPLDLPREQFVTGGRAWQLCRAGEADPGLFGIFDMHGLWFVRGNLVRDVAALNRMELLPWDTWGLIDAADADLSASDLAFLDRMADLTAGDAPEFDAVRAAYERGPGLMVPRTIRSYTESGPRMVEILPGAPGTPA